MKEFVVVALTGDYEEREKAKEDIQRVLRYRGGKMIVDAVTHIQAIINVVNEVYYSSKKRDGFQAHLKELIATEIAQYALNDKLINFSVKKKDIFETAIHGELFVIRLPETVVKCEKCGEYYEAICKLPHICKKLNSYPVKKDSYE